MEGELQRVLGANLRSHRQALGLSQEAMADLLGIHRTYLGAMERGEKNITLQTLERLATCLNVAPQALLRAAVDAEADVGVSQAEEVAAQASTHEQEDLRQGQRRGDPQMGR